MSVFSLEPETWLGIGTAIGGAVIAIVGGIHGSHRMQETKERVVGLSIAGGIFQSGQEQLALQGSADMVKAARELTNAVKGLTKSATEIADRIAHFDETTEREARDKTHEQLDEVHDAIRELKRDISRPPS